MLPRAERAPSVQERARGASTLLITTLLALSVPRRAIMLAREDPLLQRTGAIPEVYFNLRAPRERSRSRVFIPFRRIYGARCARQMNVLRLM